MSALRIIVAGASGSVGREAVALLKKQGHRVTALSRTAGSLSSIADRVIAFDATTGIPELAGHDALLSTLGASVAMRHRDMRSYRNVDYKANLNLLHACQRAGIRRVVYVSAHIESGYAETAYIRAHEEVVNALSSTAGLSYTVIRPTGIFSAFGDMIDMSRRGAIPVIDGGGARTNPIHQADVAQACTNFIEQGPVEVSIGGPDILSRRDIAYLAFAVTEKRPRLVSAPAGLMRFGGTVVRPFNGRLGELLQFVSKVSTVDAIAPKFGTRRLVDYFEELARVTTNA
ncbi:3-beta hydroxysteroid dehydrogenase [Bryobacterales bacterium F-183]|nr:3-beta hydroxysteroid dehydrogenase [Bryobacterales bacterium F-183]